MTTPHRGCVYILGSTRFGWYKIGKSRTVSVRVQNLGVLLPFKIEVFAVWATSNPSLLERLFHEKYTENAINGEWFSFSRLVLAEIVDDEPPCEARRIFPGEATSLARYSNITRDVVVTIPEPTKKGKKPHPLLVALGTTFPELMKLWLQHEGLEPTGENKQLAREAVRQFLLESKGPEATSNTQVM